MNELLNVLVTVAPSTMSIRSERQV